MKLYYTNGACSLATRILINELGIPCEFEKVDLKSKKTEKGKDYLSINPKGSVPALAIDEHTVLTENSVIQQYLADKHQSSQTLPPTNDMKRYRVLEWVNFIATELHKGASPLFNSKLSQQIKEEIFIPNLKNKLSYTEKQLNKNQYLLGDFTLADAYLFVVLTWLPFVNINLAEWPNLNRYFGELKKRESIQQSLKQEA